MSVTNFKYGEPETGAASVWWDWLPIGVCALDRDFVVRGWNRQLVTWTSLPAQTVCGSRLAEIFPAFDAELFAPKLAQVLDTGLEWILAPPKIHHFLPLASSIPKAVDGMVQEVRLMRHATAADQVLVLLTDVTEAWVLRSELQGMSQQHLGILRELKAIQDTVLAARIATRRAESTCYRETARSQAIEAELRCQTNEYIASKAREAEHRVRLEQLVLDLTMARQQAETATRSKSEFLANMSHEIRTPMTAILGYTELLRNPELAEEHRGHAIDAIQRSGAHLLDVINDILDISRIEAGKMTIDWKPTSICDILADVLDMMRSRASEKGLRLDTYLSTPLPDQFLCDATRLRQILVNLVGNAIKFTSEGTVLVSVRWNDPGEAYGKLVVAVDDSGVGIAPDVLEHLFQPFVQADSRASRQFGGSGLGLAISQRLAQMLSGEIRVKSEPGHGSCFTLELPCPASLPAHPGLASRIQVTGAVPMPPPDAHAHVDLHGARILVVDDAVDNRKLLSFHLKKAGATVDLAENGQEALDRIAAAGDQPYDVILMDMQMPVLDGYDATRRLREMGNLVPVIAVTAHAMSEDRAKCLASGCSDYLTKPIQRELLLETTQRWLQRTLAVAGQ